MATFIGIETKPGLFVAAVSDTSSPGNTGLHRKTFSLTLREMPEFVSAVGTELLDCPEARFPFLVFARASDTATKFRLGRRRTGDRHGDSQTDDEHMERQAVADRHPVEL